MIRYRILKEKSVFNAGAMVRDITEVKHTMKPIQSEKKLNQ